MEKLSIIGLDLAKNGFQAHGARADGSVAFRTKQTRAKLLPFPASAPRCIVAMEACASAHHWTREIGALGHEVRLIAPVYVKPFVKRQKNDMADSQRTCPVSDIHFFSANPFAVTQSKAEIGLGHLAAICYSARIELPSCQMGAERSAASVPMQTGTVALLFFPSRKSPLPA